MQPRLVLFSEFSEQLCQRKNVQWRRRLEHQKRIGVRNAGARRIGAAGANSGRQLLLLRRPRAEVVEHAMENLGMILAIRSVRGALAMVLTEKGRKIEEKLRAKRTRTRKKRARPRNDHDHHHGHHQTARIISKRTVQKKYQISFAHDLGLN